MVLLGERVLKKLPVTKKENAPYEKGSVSRVREAGPFCFPGKGVRDMIYRGGRIRPEHGDHGAFSVYVWDRNGRFLGKVDRVSQGIELINEADRQLNLKF